MIVQGLSLEALVRLMKLDRRRDDEAWLHFGIEPSAAQPQEPDFERRWPAE